MLPTSGTIYIFEKLPNGRKITIPVEDTPDDLSFLMGPIPPAIPSALNVADAKPKNSVSVPKGNVYPSRDLQTNQPQKSPFTQVPAQDRMSSQPKAPFAPTPAKPRLTMDDFYGISDRPVGPPANPKPETDTNASARDELSHIAYTPIPQKPKFPKFNMPGGFGAFPKFQTAPGAFKPRTPGALPKFPRLPGTLPTTPRPSPFPKGTTEPTYFPDNLSPFPPPDAVPPDKPFRTMPTGVPAGIKPSGFPPPKVSKIPSVTGNEPIFEPQSTPKTDAPTAIIPDIPQAQTSAPTVPDWDFDVPEDVYDEPVPDETDVVPQLSEQSSNEDAYSEDVQSADPPINQPVNPFTGSPSPITGEADKGAAVEAGISPIPTQPRIVPRKGINPKKGGRGGSSWGRAGGFLLVLLSLGGMSLPLIQKVRLEAGYLAKETQDAVTMLISPPKTLPPAAPVIFNPLVGPDGKTITPLNTDFGIIIPKIGVNAVVIPNVNPAKLNEYNKALSEGVAHASTSFTPDQKGTVYLFSHSTNYQWFVNKLNAVFYLVKNLEAGDQIVLFYKGVRYTYVLREKRIVKPSSITYLVPETDKKSLILQTCWPPGSVAERLLLFADLINEADGQT